MNRRAMLWAEAAKFLEAETPVALATVARRRGSLPMADDAKMLIANGNRARGTVGGGCVEADVVAAALDAIEHGTPRMVKQSLNADLAGDVGLSCGGTVELFVEPLMPDPKMVSLCRAVAKGIEERKAVTVVTKLDWAKGPVKAARIEGEWIVCADGTENLDVADVDTRHSGRILLDSERGRLVEWVHRIPRLVIFGAGHVGAAIAKLAADVGFHIVVVDDREEFASPQKVPDAHEVVVADPSQFAQRLVIDEDDFLLATTRGHRHDALVIEKIAPSAAAYVGMLGSRRKREVVLNALATSGVSREALNRVRTPIGLDIGAETPQEIAVSVVAELIQVRRLGETLQ